MSQPQHPIKTHNMVNHEVPRHRFAVHPISARTLGRGSLPTLRVMVHCTMRVRKTRPAARLRLGKPGDALRLIFQ
jgi:hypothetical protein